MIHVRSFDASAVTHLTIAGWTGRNQEALEKHIRELEDLGVRRPASTPIFYRVAAQLLTTDDAIEVLGEASSGEAEPVLVALDGELWVGVGSDHTDRKAETLGVTLSKQLCAKPVSAQLWRYADVSDRWDDLELRSYAVIDGQRSLYQEGTLRSMRPPMELMHLSGRQSMPDGAAMFCGTLAVHGGIRPAERFDVELKDPKTGQTLTAAYAIHSLPDRG
ncbi:DUF2848 domain-containing protein [Lichenifustis flavocetrariae]|uniref:DUF2848 domain-containing protein n=1 Tax=Lichenifustis flavocetrariae TaxID=2949735 RepID=A0AA41YTE7_9HYPH|nr:DUF2848 domain-containing protein [Lichenifustis flavocetrariae]MCW6507824.1 DUF2848 domain-containing protein [Lichenifustis flavocetrariae]